MIALINNQYLCIILEREMHSFIYQYFLNPLVICGKKHNFPDNFIGVLS